MSSHSVGNYHGPELTLLVLYIMKQINDFVTAQL